MKTFFLLAAMCLGLACVSSPAQAHGFGFRRPGVRVVNAQPVFAAPSVTVVNGRSGVFGLRRSTTVIQSNGAVIRVGR
jgi:hypothetical protein